MKRIVLSVLMLTAAISLSAQTGFHAGAQFTFNGVFIHNQNSYGFSEMDYEMKFGVAPGLAFGYNFDVNNGVQVEFNYATMGQNYYDKIRDFSDSTGNNVPKVDTYRKIGLNYFQIPIMYRFQTEKKKKKNAVFHVMGGPSIGILLGAEQTWEADIANDGVLVDVTDVVPQAISGFDASTADKDYFNSIDVGLQLAVGTSIFINDQLFITPELRMYYGFVDINSEDTRDLYNDFVFSRNAAVGISVGIHYLTQE